MRACTNEISILKSPAFFKSVFTPGQSFSLVSLDRNQNTMDLFRFLLCGLFHIAIRSMIGQNIVGRGDSTRYRKETMMKLSNQNLDHQKLSMFTILQHWICFARRLAGKATTTIHVSITVQRSPAKLPTMLKRITFNIVATETELCDFSTGSNHIVLSHMNRTAPWLVW